MDKEKKKKLWRFCGGSGDGSHFGLAGADSYHAWSLSSSTFSARLAVKSEELAKYFGNQFIDIWADYLINKRECE